MAVVLWPTVSSKTEQNQAAACELEEEAHLHEGTWYTLMKTDDTVAGAGKYSTQTFHPYLVVDPVVVKGEPRALDDGEHIEYVRGVSLEEVSLFRLHLDELSTASCRQRCENCLSCLSAPTTVSKQSDFLGEADSHGQKTDPLRRDIFESSIGDWASCYRCAVLSKRILALFFDLSCPQVYVWSASRFS